MRRSSARSRWGDFQRAGEILPDSSEHYLDAVSWSNDAGGRMLV
jgi:hypothetical protein